MYRIGQYKIITEQEMDTHQKKVLRWKRQLVASEIKWSDDFVAGLQNRNLLSDVVLSQIQVLRLLIAVPYTCFRKNGWRRFLL